MTRKISEFFKNEKGDWNHPDVSFLMDLAESGEQPEDLIRRLARDFLQRAFKSGWSGPPYDPLYLARLKGLHLTSRTPLFPSKPVELLIRPNQSLELRHDENTDPPQIRFAISRAVVQTLLPNCHEIIRREEAPYYLPGESMDMECLLDAGAAELLLPEQNFLADLAEGNLSLQTTLQFAETYRAPFEAVLIRIAQLSLLPCALVFVSERKGRKSRQDEIAMEFDFGLDAVHHDSKLRVDYIIGNEDARSAIAKDKAIAEGTALYKCLQKETVVEDFERWDQVHGMHRVMACRLPSGDERKPRRAAALVRFEHS